MQKDLLRRIFPIQYSNHVKELLRDVSALTHLLIVINFFSSFVSFSSFQKKTFIFLISVKKKLFVYVPSVILYMLDGSAGNLLKAQRSLGRWIITRGRTLPYYYHRVCLFAFVCFVFNRIDPECCIRKPSQISTTTNKKLFLED